MLCSAELVAGRLFAGRYSRAFSVYRKIKKKMKPSTDDNSEISSGTGQWSEKKISDGVGKRIRSHIDQNSGDGRECDSHLASIITSSHKNKRRTRIDLGTRFELPPDQTVEGIGSWDVEGSRILNSLGQKRDSLLPRSFGKKHVTFSDNKLKLQKAYSPSKVELPSDQTVEGIGSRELEGSRILNSLGQKRDSLLPRSFGEKRVSFSDNKLKLQKAYSPSKVELPSDQTVEGNGSQELEGSRILNSLGQKRDSLLPRSFGKKRVTFSDNKLKLQKAYSPSKIGVRKRSLVEALNMNEPFDICLSESREAVIDEAPLQRNMTEKQIEENGMVLRPGMVLLKNYIPLSKQVSIVKKCQELGLGPGGFYRPGYKDGAKLCLHMMCLGRDWDPQTRRYGKTRQHDNAEPPCIPDDFTILVSNALHDSHTLIQRHLNTSNPVEILPLITPDICIVNFYAIEGRLGLHQDRDESKESLHNGLPVVSFSIGNSAEFLYGDERDVQKAKKVLLESGDVLIFGGNSRHIFHGVTSIIPNTAPPALSDDIKLRPGRLNLTFRQY